MIVDNWPFEPEPPDPRLTFTVYSAHVLLGIPAGTLRRWVAEGRLVAVDDGAWPPRYLADDVWRVAVMYGRVA